MKKRSYLIQRGKFDNRPDCKGIDKYLSFDYMGSCEFEWGALGKSLKRIRDDIKEYQYHQININGKIVNVFCKVDDIMYVNDTITALSGRNPPYTIEYVDFRGYIYESKDNFDINKTDHWWDIYNDFMFWKDNKVYTKNILSEIFPKQDNMIIKFKNKIMNLIK